MLVFIGVLSLFIIILNVRKRAIEIKVPSLNDIMDMPTGDKIKDIQYVDGCLLYCIGMVLIIPFVLLIAYIFYLICASFK